MNNIQPRQPGQPKTLDHVWIDDTIPRLVVDELDSVHLPNADARDYAAFWRDQQSICGMAARAKHYAREVERFIALVEHSSRDSFNRHAYQLFAITRLNNVCMLAVALLPARIAANRHAKREQGYAFLCTLEEPDDHPLRRIGEIAFGLAGVDAAEITNDAIAYAGRGSYSQGKPGRSDAHHLDERQALEHYIVNLPFASDLIAHANRHHEMATIFTASLTDGDLGPEAYEVATAAREGAILQLHIALTRLAMAGPVSDLIANHAALRQAIVDAPPHVQAVLAIAEEQGQHMRRLLAAYPY